jgi:uncharacterized protein (DUF1330 family)
LQRGGVKEKLVGSRAIACPIKSYVNLKITRRMRSGIILVVQLFIQTNQEAKFQQYEQEAAQIMQKYQGQIEKVIRPISTEQCQEQPDEVHIVWFPSLGQFELYRQDPDLVKLAELRQSAISRTEIIIGQESNPYF